MSTPIPVPGWYNDGTPGQLRWFDGMSWTDRVRRRPDPSEYVGNLGEAPVVTKTPALAYAAVPSQPTGSTPKLPVQRSATQPRPPARRPAPIEPNVDRPRREPNVDRPRREPNVYRPRQQLADFDYVPGYPLPAFGSPFLRPEPEQQRPTEIPEPRDTGLASKFMMLAMVVTGLVTVLTAGVVVFGAA